MVVKSRGRIDKKLFREIHRVVPIACVDVVAYFDDAVLLLKRKTEPLKNSWFFPGGRVYRGEKISQAAVRIVKSESGMEVTDPIVIGVEETMFQTDPFGHGDGSHTINTVCKARICGGKLKVDRNHSDGRLTRWSDPPKGVVLHEYVVRNIHRAFEWCETG